MRYVRILLALLLTVILLIVARNTSRGRPEQLSYTEQGVTFDLNTVPKADELGVTQIAVKITGDIQDSSRVVFRQAKYGTTDLTNDDNFSVLIMKPSDSVQHEYVIAITTGPKGGRVYYYFELTDNEYSPLVSFKAEGNQPFYTKFIGAVPQYVLIGHIFLMFATVFCLALAAMHAFNLLKGGTDAGPMARMIFLAALAAFLGGYPFGFAMNYYAFGAIWEGVPFGTDATDNKTQLLFAYLLFVCFSSLASLTNRRCGRDLFSTNTLAKLTFGALALQLLTYLIPHSIQFGKMLTYGVCYGFMGVLLAIYIVALSRGGGSKRLG
jgi:hypothetical protein